MVFPGIENVCEAMRGPESVHVQAEEDDARVNEKCTVSPGSTVKGEPSGRDVVP